MSSPHDDLASELRRLGGSVSLSWQRGVYRAGWCAPDGSFALASSGELEDAIHRLLAIAERDNAG